MARPLTGKRPAVVRQATYMTDADVDAWEQDTRDLLRKAAPSEDAQNAHAKFRELCMWMRAAVMLLLVLSAAPVWAQGQAPNRKDVVEAVSNADPARFACAHQEGRSCKTDWIKAVAWALHQTDSRWGLNGKRGNANDISMDVVTFRIGPTDRHVQAFDICGACGGGNPSVVWNDITNWATIGNPGTAVWVQPVAVGGTSSGGGGTPLPAPPSPAPAAPVNLQPILDAIAALAVKIDAVAGVAVEARDAAKSAEHDAREINAARMDAPPVPVLSVPCLTGRVPRAFGGSTGVTFCPVP